MTETEDVIISVGNLLGEDKPLLFYFEKKCKESEVEQKELHYIAGYLVSRFKSKYPHLVKTSDMNGRKG